jgi:protein involved in ribonucleotide reduction
MTPTPSQIKAMQKQVAELTKELVRLKRDEEMYKRILDLIATSNPNKTAEYCIALAKKALE